MNLKKYTAPTMREALLMVKEDLGSQAVIIRTEQIKQNGQNAIVVTAAIDEAAYAQPAPLVSAPSSISNSTHRGAPQELSPLSSQLSAITGGYDRFASQTNAPKHVEPQATSSPQISQFVEPELTESSFVPTSFAKAEAKIEAKEDTKAEKSSQINAEELGNVLAQKLGAAVLSMQDEMKQDLHKELNILRSDVLDLKGQMNVSSEGSSPIPTDFKTISAHLLDRGITQSHINDIVAELALRLGPKERDTESLLREARFYLQKRMFISGSIQLNPRRAVVAVFVGPTGVGKSTTIAKLATHMILHEGRKVAILSTDSYRMGALEQMSLFTQAAGINFEAVFDESELDEAIDRLAHHDVILVDTAGRSQNHTEHVDELRKLVRKTIPDEVHLVLSASTREKDIESIFIRFRDIGINRLCYTKLDEASEPGVLYNLSVSKGVPLSYIANGQAIPDDLRVASAPEVVQLILDGVL